MLTSLDVLRDLNTPCEPTKPHTNELDGFYRAFMYSAKQAGRSQHHQAGSQVAEAERREDRVCKVRNQFGSEV